MGRYELSDFEWAAIEPRLPNKPRGLPRVDDRRVLNGIFWVLRSGAPWADVPARYGPPTTIYNRFNRWRKAGVWDRLMGAITKAYDGDVQMMSTGTEVSPDVGFQNSLPGRFWFRGSAGIVIGLGPPGRAAAAFRRRRRRDEGFRANMLGNEIGMLAQAIA